MNRDKNKSGDEHSGASSYVDVSQVDDLWVVKTKVWINEYNNYVDISFECEDKKDLIGQLMRYKLLPRF